MQPYKTQLRVRYHEMDALGHVNNAVYQHYLEQAAIEHSEYLGLNLDRYRELGGWFIMRRVEIDYLRPAIAGDILEVTTWVHEMRALVLSVATKFVNRAVTTCCSKQRRCGSGWMRSPCVPAQFLIP